LRRGLPHFIADYSATEDVWTRALPALTFLFAVEVIVNAPKKGFAIYQDVLVVAAAFAVLVAVWALGNAMRGRKPLARPERVGSFEVAFFVVVPALVPIVVGSQEGSALATVLFNIVVLAGIYVVTSYGLVSMTRWGFGRLTRQLEAIVSLVARALPLVALLVTFLFLTAEVWQTAGELNGVAYVLATSLFVVVGVVFLVSRLPRDIGELNRFDNVDEITELIADSPACELPVTTDAPDLGRREWGNVGLVAVFSQGLQIVLVSGLIGVFFVILGFLLVDEETTMSWAGSVDVLATWTLGDQELVITEQLLRVAGFLTAFTSLNFTVYLLTDETYRTEFRSEVVAELREAFAVRAVYLSYLEDQPSAKVLPT
jgi:hypothetical protein